jgi:hypothetical protein
MTSYQLPYADKHFGNEGPYAAYLRTSTLEVSLSAMESTQKVTGTSKAESATLLNVRLHLHLGLTFAKFIFRPNGKTSLGFATIHKNQYLQSSCELLRKSYRIKPRAS